MIDVELVGGNLAPEGPSPEELQRLCRLAGERRGVRSAHVAVEYVAPARIAALNERYRGKAEPTDVLSFPIDGVERLAGPEGPSGQPRELGDIVICPAHTVDLREAIVHGMLHLLGMDHESDAGEMLLLQDELLTQARR